MQDWREAGLLAPSVVRLHKVHGKSSAKSRSSHLAVYRSSHFLSEISKPV
jgi:hypothetical protein